MNERIAAMNERRFLTDTGLRLRAVEPDDAELMWEVETDSTQWIDNGMSAPFSRNNLREYALNYDADPMRSGQIRLVVEIRQDEENWKFAGLADLYDISPIGRTAFIGIYILPEFRDGCIAQRTLSQLEDYASNLLNLRILGAKISDVNIGSIRLFEKSGYLKTGELPDWLMSGNELHTVILYCKHLRWNQSMKK